LGVLVCISALNKARRTSLVIIIVIITAVIKLLLLLLSCCHAQMTLPPCTSPDHAVLASS